MKKRIALFLCLLALCAFTACAEQKDDAVRADPSSGSSSKTESAQIPNPFLNCDTLEDAAKVAGFSLAAPDAVDGYDTRAVQAIKEEMIQAIYQKGEDRLLIRKAAGSDDISGDSTAYTEANTVAVGGLSVTMKGENGTVSIAVWTNGGYTYAVDAQDIPLTQSAMSTLIAGVQ